MKTLGVVLDSRLTFEKHVSSVIRSCNYHAMAIRHIRHLLTPDLVQKLACSLILSRLHYCNLLLHGAPIGVISKLQRMQNNVARIVVRADRRANAMPLLRQLHWLPEDSRVEYKLALLTFKVRTTTVPSYVSNLLSSQRDSGYCLHSSSIPLLAVPVLKVILLLARFVLLLGYLECAPPLTVLSSQTVAVFKSRLKTFLFNRAFN